MYTLGINAAFHDSAACIIKDGILLAAAEEERFTHIKHGKRPLPFSTYELPFHAIDFCLRTAGIRLRDVDHAAYSFDPSFITAQQGDGYIGDRKIKAGINHYSEWDPLFHTYIRNAPRYLTDGYPHHLQTSFAGTDIKSFQWHYIKHHLAHASSAFLPSPFEESAVMVIDGRGEQVSTSYYMGSGNELHTLGEVCMPHSLGMLYEKVTSYLGFLHSSDEYKVMALASYGEPVYVDVFRDCIHIEPNGRYSITDPMLEEKFGPARKIKDPFTLFHFNIAHSLQKVLEETVVALAGWLHKQTGTQQLCMAGGVALNCVMNTAIRNNTPFKNIWVQPAAGDSGTALGAALWVDNRERKAAKKGFYMDHAYWGPEYSDDEVEFFLKYCGLDYRKMDDVARETAMLLAEDKIIGWFGGKMEFGPRALGARSILASPLNPSMQKRLNEIKDREDFRPVAPVVLEEDVAEWFENGSVSPFMLFVYDVKTEKINKIPAVTHIDGTARIQTINRRQHPLYYDVLNEFKKITGIPILVNTSFNTRGKPVVCAPRDAIECFFTSPFDALVINSFLLEKKTAAPASVSHDKVHSLTTIAAT